MNACSAHPRSTCVLAVQHYKFTNPGIWSSSVAIHKSVHHSLPLVTVIHALHPHLLMINPLVFAYFFSAGVRQTIESTACTAPWSSDYQKCARILRYIGPVCFFPAKQKRVDSTYLPRVPCKRAADAERDAFPQTVPMSLRWRCGSHWDRHRLLCER